MPATKPASVNSLANMTQPTERSVEKMEALLASEYQVVVDGKLATRAAAVAEFKKRALTNKAVQTTSTVDKVMLSSNLAIATGVITLKTELKTGKEHYTIVLREGNDRWQVVAEHISEVAQ